MKTLRCLQFVFALVCGAATIAQTTPQTVAIKIQNPSFEEPLTGNPYVEIYPCGTNFKPRNPQQQISGWTYAGSGSDTPSVWTVVNATPGYGYCPFSAPPDGRKLLELRYFYDPPLTVSQDLGNIQKLVPAINPQGDIIGFYTLKFSVATRFYSYTGKFAAWLSVAPTGIATDRTCYLCTPPASPIFCSTRGYATGDFLEITAICPSQAIYGELFLTLASETPNWGVLFDKVSLTFTSKP